ncbi:hypothetical protein HN285_03175 [Acinetobacter baumannii]|uniref:hypothetical protein n=1 Tax=Acinetobacter baumannii TaxID=470 RepID=UPI001897286B|nr:hypothetical protein [Acinetobacter baumannii]MBF6745489.1 hypothetical protein [Acinetobacter baumannii]MBF6831552.1 hypothetical protein [Acinetobacter baumannii]MBF6839110.1 hypothetical protein [Acinetobacter baumannii]MBF6919854.1 hypothetical protein [Acinetobacter baumannii]MBF6929422.1 hypothetical protein [Acinetobacter baumannii]
MNWILLNKRWSLIILLTVLYIIQIGYTNHLAGKLKQADQQCMAQIQDIERKQVKALAEAQNEFNQVSADYEKLKSEQRTKVEYVEREVQKIIERPVYLNRCIDSDGVQQINSLIEAKHTS